VEILSFCAENRHYSTSFYDCMSDLSQLTIPSKHLNNPHLDSIFILEKLLKTYITLSSINILAVQLLKNGVLKGLFDIVLNGYTYIAFQEVHPLCLKISSNMDLSEVSLRVILSLSKHEDCKQLLLDCGVSHILLRMLMISVQEIFVDINGKYMNNDKNILSNVGGENSGEYPDIPYLLTSLKTYNLYNKKLSQNSNICLETLYILCLCANYYYSALFDTYPLSCPVILAGWGADLTGVDLIEGRTESKVRICIGYL
jgi:hypothetical protein